MMPKGVEHRFSTYSSSIQRMRVKIPMMPKGVEHPQREQPKAIVKWVKIPMMPKGVEHNHPVNRDLPPEK